MEPGEHSVQIDGVTQAYEVVGTGPVCLVHSGGPGVHSGYLRMPLLEERLAMVYLDPVGTRRSGLVPGGDYSVARYADFARKLIAHLGVDRPYFLGHPHADHRRYLGLHLPVQVGARAAPRNARVPVARPRHPAGTSGTSSSRGTSPTRCSG
ncbi:alpha/beta hydrolase [Lentzea alba]|uniref:alpha/beta fold hydrolase n=1 Tax=Lentzea alba TaxID=2714351 RepID=UPI0039BF27A7